LDQGTRQSPCFRKKAVGIHSDTLSSASIAIGMFSTGSYVNPLTIQAEANADLLQGTVRPEKV
jgi:hypothetical protein